jgi:hypothetical protein
MLQRCGTSTVSIAFIDIFAFQDLRRTDSDVRRFVACLFVPFGLVFVGTFPLHIINVNQGF